VLLVVDYAETRTHQLAELLPRLWATDCAPVRLLLLARAAGDWWQQLGRDLGDPLGTPTVLSTLDDTLEEQRQAFRAAVTALATRVPGLGIGTDVDWQAQAERTPFPADLPDARYGDPLTLQLVALLSLLDRATPGDPAAHAGDGGWTDNPEQDLLTQHEEKYWSATAPGWLNLQHDTLAEVVTAATLAGAADRDEALAVLRELPSLQGQPENGRIAVANWLRDLYPAPAGHEWGGLQPDRVGEHLTAATLTQHPRLLAGILASASETQTYRAVTVLARALVNSTIPDGSRMQLSGQLSDMFAVSEVGSRLAQVTLQVATETVDPAPLIAALDVVLGKLPDDPLRDLAYRFPERSLALAGLAADVARTLVDRLRQTPGGDEGSRNDLAGALNNLSNRLSDLGRREDALTAIEEAVRLRRQLAAARPDAFTPDLARSLNNLSNRLSDLGRREDALTAAQEAAELG
jgi:tetratricopeptide (TPR) repeat protein